MSLVLVAGRVCAPGPASPGEAHGGMRGTVPSTCTVEPTSGTVERAATSVALYPLCPSPGTAPHGRSACVGDEGPLSVFFSVWVWRCQPHSGELVDAVLHCRYLSR